MIARFVDGPLAGADQEYPAETEYVDLYNSPDDPHAVVRYMYYGTGVEQNGREIHLFRVECGNMGQPPAVCSWAGTATTFETNLTQEDRELLRGMRISC